VQEFALVKANQTGTPRHVHRKGRRFQWGARFFVACQDEWILVSKLRIDYKGESRGRAKKARINSPAVPEAAGRIAKLNLLLRRYKETKADVHI
jgi:hypothetical protein